MIDVVVDPAAGADALTIAGRLRDSLQLSSFMSISATVYVGCGSADLIRPEHARPHVIMPMAVSKPDPLVRAQVGAADAVVLMDHDELRRLRKTLGDIPVLLVEQDLHSGVLQCTTPRDAAGIDRFEQACPEVFESISALGTIPPKFDFRRVAEVVSEAACAATASARP